jgi:hypothetical protein
MSTSANKVQREMRHVVRRTAPIGVDLFEAKKDLRVSRQRSARLIDSVLRDAGSGDGPADLSANLRRYLGRD